MILTGGNDADPARQPPKGGLGVCAFPWEMLYSSLMGGVNMSETRIKTEREQKLTAALYAERPGEVEHVRASEYYHGITTWFTDGRKP
jgi:hypothetical protein